MPERIEVWSCGGGTQSAAIAALIVQGQLPKPDLAVIVDTEREVSETWAYHDAVIRPELEKAGVELHRVPKSRYATVDLYGGSNKDKLLIPAFTTFSGKVGKLPTYCSNEWKSRVVQRFCNERFPNAEGFTIWLGISMDEMERMRFARGKWQYSHPLVDQRMRRADCVSLVHAMGWPTPPRSRCWMCPNQRSSEWRDLRENHPADWDKAVAFEKDLNGGAETFALHSSGQPLSELADDHPDLFGGDCMSGMCFV
jgi:hypothetical protein